MDTAIICDRCNHIVSINVDLCCARPQDPKYKYIPFLPYYWELATGNDTIIDIREDGKEIYCIEISNAERDAFKKLASCKGLLYYDRILLWKGADGTICYQLE